MLPYSIDLFRYILCCAFIILALVIECSSQSISGVVEDENQEPVPYANIFFRELNTGTSADANGRYFLTIDPGIYQVVVSAVGYESVSKKVIVKDKPLGVDFQLRSSSTELNEVIVKVKRKDPAYEIIQHVIDSKERYLKQVASSRTSVYLRASEVVDNHKKKVDAEKDQQTDIDQKGPPQDIFEEQRKKEDARLEKINLVEMQVVVNYQYPDRYKEEREAYKAYGSRDGLFIPVFSDADFNFYKNLIDLKGISEVPLISPVSRTAILSYKFKLEEILKEGSDVVYKIRITPRKTGDATCRGFIYINEGTWNINSLEVTLQKGTLKFYDEFTIRQTYENIDSLWLPVRQNFYYQTKAGSKLFTGNTVMVYSQFQPGYVFPPKFFNNEVAVTLKEAYQKDTSYWNSNRAIPLTEDQRKVINYRDSIHAAQNTQAYLDSIESRYNRVTIGEVLYHGVGFRKQTSKRDIRFPSLLELVGFEVVGGFRFGPSVRYFRRFENGRMMSLNTGFSFGIKNEDWTGSFNSWFRYNPFRLGDVAFRTGRSFYSINSFDAYLNQLRISNYILHEHVDFFHRIELINGLYVSTDVNFSNRMSVNGYDASSIINRIIDEDDPINFRDYQAFSTTVRLAYTPQQKYMREPNQKIVLGSKYPTFSIAHRKGWKAVFRSDVDYDYVEGAIEQNLLLGTLGNSRYKLMAGKFINTRQLHLIDLKRFRQSDPYLYSDPLNSFQLLDTSMSATNWFLEGHYIHHFNGAIINNIPLIKKLKLRTVAGAGFMWIRENGFRHEEIFGGVERVFKLGARRRLRIGVYGVLSESNYAGPSTGYKISFDIIDTWKRDWSY